MKAEYIPPREDVILQNEAPDDVYIIVSGEVKIIGCEGERECCWDSTVWRHVWRSWCTLLQTSKLYVPNQDPFTTLERG